MNKKYLKDLKQLGLNIRFYRGNKNYNQEFLAEKAGISIVYLSKVENGHANATLSVIFGIAKALDVPVAKLFEFRE